MKKHFETLGLNEGATQEQIQIAYERLSKELNPSNNDSEEFFKEEYQKVKEAYRALSNSSILATQKGAKYGIKTPKKTTTVQKKNKITKKLKVIFLILAIIPAIGIYLYMSFGNTTSPVNLKSLVYETQSSRWMKSKISNNIIFLKENMKPFSGNLSKDINAYEGTFLDGKKNGLHKEYVSGSLIREGRFENGIPVGVHKNWHRDRQLAMEVTFSNGKRKGLSKKWDRNGNLISLDFDQNKILDYLTNYFNSSKNLNIVEGKYIDDNGYNFSVIKILDRYYAIMTNNFKNEGTDSKTFHIGDVKAIFSGSEVINEYKGFYFMASKKIEPVFVDYKTVFNANYLNFNLVSDGRVFFFNKK